MEKLMNNIKKYWGWVTLSVGILSVVFNFFIKILDGLDAQNDELAKAIQMSEKAIIWNKDIPIIERAGVCDDYLARGYNSYTKKLCENVILQDSSLAMGGKIENEESMD